jgi:hypothetical protein
MTIEPELESSLRSIYEEIMWLARRPNVTPGRARAWYTHIMAESVKRRVRRFTGQVSRAAVTGEESLMLEHFMRIQTNLSSLVERHLAADTPNAEEFVQLVVECEQVHIVSRSENYATMRAKGDYVVAGIELMDWSTVAPERQATLWRTMLRGRVANALGFLPVTATKA